MTDHLVISDNFAGIYPAEGFDEVPIDHAFTAAVTSCVRHDDVRASFAAGAAPAVVEPVKTWPDGFRTVYARAVVLGDIAQLGSGNAEDLRLRDAASAAMLEACRLMGQRAQARFPGAKQILANTVGPLMRHVTFAPAEVARVRLLVSKDGDRMAILHGCYYALGGA